MTFDRLLAFGLPIGLVEKMKLFVEAVGVMWDDSGTVFVLSCSCSTVDLRVSLHGPYVIPLTHPTLSACSFLGVKIEN